MTSGFKSYRLDIIYNHQVIGKLHLDRDTDNLLLEYTHAWKQAGFPITPHLGFSEPIPSVNVRRFLQNLLPENQGLDYLIDYLGVARSNVFSLIEGIGRDTSGAIMFLPENSLQKMETSFRAVTEDELMMRLSDPELWHMEVWDGKPRLSVAGVQSKINILQLDGKLGFGEGELCSTHILKFEKNAQQHLVINEFVTMNLARLIGFDTAHVELKYFGQYPALLVERFDRKLFNSQSVKRRHMIDACQACNLGVDRKYERNLGKQRDVQHIRDGVSLTRLFSISDYCENPIAVRLTMLRWVLFNLCIYNSDAHGKNFSFFVGRSGLNPAPLYDLVNVRMYPEFEQDLAMAIGDEFDSDSINAYQLVEFADECGIAKSLLQRNIKRIAQEIIEKIDTAIDMVEIRDGSQSEYLARYRKMIVARCTHFLEQVAIIPEIEL